MRKEYLLIGMLAAAVVGLTVTVVLQARSNRDEVAAVIPPGPYVHASDPVAAGRYLMIIGGCNDCHTVDWDRTHGDVPESQWLLGSPVGFNGPWGTSYPGNVRLFMQNMSEDAWVQYAQRWHAVPPMPSMNLNRMSEQDLRAMHQYARSLEPVGEPVPRNQPPGESPIGPYFDFTVKNLPAERAGQ